MKRKKSLLPRKFKDGLCCKIPILKQTKQKHGMLSFYFGYCDKISQQKVSQGREGLFHPQQFQVTLHRSREVRGARI